MLSSFHNAEAILPSEGTTSRMTSPEAARRLPREERNHDDRDAHARDRAREAAQPRRRGHRVTSHRSTRSVTRKNATLTSTTKVMAAYIAGRS